MTSPTIAVLAYTGAQLIDIIGPAEAFSVANTCLQGGDLYRGRPGQDAYRVVICSLDGRDIKTSSGQRIGVAGSLTELDSIDTLVVPGTYQWRAAMENPGLIAAVHNSAARSRRVASVCAGAFLLGAADLLEGRRATTHWLLFDDFARAFPNTHLQRGPIFVRDGDVYSSAGATAGIDLALALVEADRGPQVARKAAGFLVMFMQRPGGQEQFSVRLRAGAPGEPLQALLDAIVTMPGDDHRVESMSRRAGFSERHLTRLFEREVGMSPARYVEQVRLEAARVLLEATDLPISAVASEAGLGSAETLRRRFSTELGVTPGAYRARFRTTGIRRSVNGHPLAAGAHTETSSFRAPANSFSVQSNA